MNEDPKSGKLDPEIAQLMGISPVEPETAPDFTDLFGEEQAVERAEAESVDLTTKGFSPIEKFEEEPKPFFKDKDYYRKLLAGESEAAKKVHDLLSQLLAATDANDRSALRNRLIPAFWDLAAGIASRISENPPLPKLLLLRFGILAPNLLSPEQRDMICRIIFENKTGEPIYYFDEWMLKIVQGSINPSATDEIKQTKGDTNQKLQEKIEKRKGQRQAEFAILQNKILQLDACEANLLNQVQCILKHHTRAEYAGLKDAFTAEQKEAITEIGTILRNLSNLDTQIRDCYLSLQEMDKELQNLEEKSQGAQSSAVDKSTITNEFNSIRQMTKMCVGRQGNHFPILMKQYIRPNMAEIATRENVLSIMAQTEALDPGLFLRTYKTQTTRIVPYMILLPNYGDTGVCWEPFERYNRASSRGRIAVPLYPKDLKVAVVTALADLRWQVAKEKAQHYWMEEGITGRYYQCFQERKIKGDVREYFIRDYLLWITKESQGTQKLDREIRGIFWRMMPFPQEVKDNLKNRGFVYNELYKKDVNISKSDGY